MMGLLVVADAANSDSSSYTHIAAAVTLLTGLGAWVTAYVSRRNARDETKTSDRQSGVEQFGIVGTLAEQMADKMFEHVEKARIEEQHDCDRKIADLQVQFDRMKADMSASMRECHEERAEFKALLVAKGLLEG